MKNLRIAGVILLVVCGVCLFVAFERYQANANNVRAMSGLMGGIGGALEPATPAATKHALLFALLSGGGALYCLTARRKSNG
jgi:hypothetical protein